MYDGLRNLDVPRRPKHPGARRVVRIGLVGIAVLALLLAATGAVVYKIVNDKFRAAQDDSIITDPHHGATNILVLGSDRRDVISRAERKENAALRGPSGRRADTIILIHISANSKRAVALHFPRDLRVQIPGRGTSKINSAYAGSGGGPNRVIKTVKQLTGIPIHHYVEINFSSFRKIVDSVGGVNICVQSAYDDPKSGLKIPKPGCYDMKGNMALSFVRARNIDPRADLGRIERQQLFMRALMDKVKNIGFLLNLPRVVGLATAVSENVTTSGEVDLNLARSVANKLAGDQKSVDYRIVPADPAFIGGVSYLTVRTRQAERLFRAIREDRKLPDVGKTGLSLPKRKDVSIRVLNGAGEPGLAGREAAELRRIGFRVLGTGDAKRSERTRILFEPGAELKARLLAEEYPDALVEKTLEKQSTDLVLILGLDIVEATASPSPGG